MDNWDKIDSWCLRIFGALIAVSFVIMAFSLKHSGHSFVRREKSLEKEILKTKQDVYDILRIIENHKHEGIYGKAAGIKR